MTGFPVECRSPGHVSALHPGRQDKGGRTGGGGFFAAGQPRVEPAVAAEQGEGTSPRPCRAEEAVVSPSLDENEFFLRWGTEA